MLAFVLALVLADVPTPAQLHAVTVSSYHPDSPSTGAPVTVEGTGFDQGTVVLVGGMAPRLLERTATRLVFTAPQDPKSPKGYTADVFLVTPGLPVFALGKLFVERGGLPAGNPGAPRPRGTPAPDSPRTVLEEKTEIASGKEKSYVVELSGANAATVILACTGGEVKVAVRAEGAKSEPLTRGTIDGAMSFTVTQRTLGGTADAPVRKIEVTLSTESKTPVGCSVRVGRSGTPLPR